MAMTPSGYGRFIGRVGGLAVALGIGAAIANSPGIAAADDGESSSSDASPSRRVRRTRRRRLDTGDCDGHWLVCVVNK